jgi:HlyD family secretion protein
MHRAGWLLPLLAIGCTSQDGGQIIAQGTIEVDETDIVPRVGGRISRIWAAEGAGVRAGDTLVTLVSSTLPEDLHEREARVARAEAELRDLERGARPEEISRAEAELRAAQAEDVRAARELGRMETLGASNAVAKREVDEARATAAQARERRLASEQSLQLLRAGATREAKEAARSRLAEARAALAQGHATSGELTLLAPTDGIVLPHYYRIGEVVDAGDPVVTTADVSRPWIRVFVNQRDVPGLRVGALAEAVLDGDPEHPIPGRIVSINHKAEYTPRVALTTEERADLMFGIKVQLSNSTGSAQAGLPATVRLSVISGEEIRQLAEARP